ncbi:hypothetical protein [Leifsonia sp. Leaf264]|uniref:hypothetical protein n=1 Tax=Leifsonia sp. Leaf264 TaxID=1736314 RepID=UPI000701D35A|nr:hypothetical protein [Leifsonia sp. Leaf264]KQO98661.1 hypothetical protein ASF30_11405 [Leifsonia sp. Leaf264]
MTITQPRLAGGQFTFWDGLPSDAALSHRNPDEVFTATGGEKDGRWFVQSLQTHPAPVQDGAFMRYTLHIGGQPHVNARMSTAAALVPDEVKAEATEKTHELATAGERFTVLSEVDGTVRIDELRGYVNGSSVYGLVKNSRTKGIALDKLNILAVEKGYGKQEKLAAKFDRVASTVPVTEEVTFDGIPDLGEDYSETTEFAAAYLVDGPNFGTAAPGCVFLATDIQAEDGIVNGFLWAPNDTQLFSEFGSQYTDNVHYDEENSRGIKVTKTRLGLKRMGGRIRDFDPAKVDLNTFYGTVPEDRADGYRFIMGQDS